MVWSGGSVPIAIFSRHSRSFEILSAAKTSAASRPEPPARRRSSALRSPRSAMLGSSLTASTSSRTVALQRASISQGLVSLFSRTSWRIPAATTSSGVRAAWRRAPTSSGWNRKSAPSAFRRCPRWRSLARRNALSTSGEDSTNVGGFISHLTYSVLHAPFASPRGRRRWIARRGASSHQEGPRPSAGGGRRSARPRDLGRRLPVESQGAGSRHGAAGVCGAERPRAADSGGASGGRLRRRGTRRGPRDDGAAGRPRSRLLERGTQPDWRAGAGEEGWHRGDRPRRAEGAPATGGAGSDRRRQLGRGRLGARPRLRPLDEPALHGPRRIATVAPDPLAVGAQLPGVGVVGERTIEHLEELGTGLGVLDGDDELDAV